MNITFSLTTDEWDFFKKCYSQYVSQAISEGLPVYSKSYFFRELVNEWASKQTKD